MKDWKVKIEHKKKVMTISIKASSYADAYIKTGVKYPGCIVKSISDMSS
ncbi:MAG: hypothetical protein ACT4ON_04610 [Bacteroidota bacterium]